MKSATVKKHSTKEVTVKARIQFKAAPEKVIYQVLSSDEHTTYNVYMYHGKATSCTCKATRRCYHMDGCDAREAARQPKPAMLPGETADELVVIDIEYQAYLRDKAAREAQVVADAERIVAEKQTRDASLRYAYGYHD